MESAMQLPRYVVFNLSASGGLRCFSPAPAAVEHVIGGVPFRTQALGVEALHRTRLSRADDDLAVARRSVQQQAGTATNSCDRVQNISDPDPDTVSDAGTSGVQAAAEESEDEADSSFDELFFQESFARKIDALAQLVGMEGACYRPAAVLGEVVRVIQAADQGR